MDKELSSNDDPVHRGRDYKLQNPNPADRSKVEQLVRSSEGIDKDDAYVVLEQVRLAFSATDENKFLVNELRAALPTLDVEVARRLLISLSEKERNKCLDDDMYGNKVVMSELQMLQDKFKYGHGGNDTPGPAKPAIRDAKGRQTTDKPEKGTASASGTAKDDAGEADLTAQEKDEEFEPPQSCCGKCCAATWGKLPTFYKITIIATVWLLSGWMYYRVVNEWEHSECFYYTIQAGLSVGFGAIPETKLASKAFTIILVLTGSSAIAAAMTKFIEFMLDKAKAYHDISVGTLVQATDFKDIDQDGSGDISLDELQAFFMSNKVDGRQLKPNEVAAVFKEMDKDGSGDITIAEFEDWMNGEKAIYKKVLRWLNDCKVYLFFAFWIALGVFFSMVVEGHSFVDGLYFAVTACSTGGLLAPQRTTFSMIFTGCYCIVGIPLYGFMLGTVAGILSERYMRGSSKEELKNRMNKFAKDYDKQLKEFGLCDDDGEVEYWEFLILEVLRLGKADMEVLKQIKKQFENLDTNKNNMVEVNDVMDTSVDHSAFHEEDRGEATAINIRTFKQHNGK